MISLSTRILLFSKITLFFLTLLFLLAIPDVGYSIIFLIMIINLAFFLGDIALGKPFIYVRKGTLYKITYLYIKKLNKLDEDYKVISKKRHFELFIDNKFCCSIYDFYSFWLFPVFLNKRKNQLDTKIKKGITK